VKRHGTLLPITEREYARVMYHYAGVGEDPDAGAEPEVTAVAQPRCVSGKAHLTVRVTNLGEEPASVEITTPFGRKTISEVLVDASRSVALNSRASSFDAGTVQVTASHADGSSAVIAVPYDGASCG
jgi:hypothetical protein